MLCGIAQIPRKCGKVNIYSHNYPHRLQVILWDRVYFRHTIFWWRIYRILKAPRAEIANGIFLFLRKRDGARIRYTFLCIKSSRALLHIFAINITKRRTYLHPPVLPQVCLHLLCTGSYIFTEFIQSPRNGSYELYYKR